MSLRVNECNGLLSIIRSAEEGLIWAGCLRIVRRHLELFFGKFAVFCFRSLKHTQVWVGILPKRQNLAILGEACVDVSCHGIRARESEMRKRPVDVGYYHATISDDFVELCCG